MGSALVRSMPEFAECSGWADAFAKSGLFRGSSAAEIIVRIAAGAEIGLRPFAAASGVTIIQGKPTLGAGAIAAAVKGSGKYNYRVLRHDSSACEIEFYEKWKGAEWEPVGRSVFTMDDAGRAGLLGNPTWKKYPAAMLFARAISQGARWFTPDIFAGSIYTAEELGGRVKEEDVRGEEDYDRDAEGREEQKIAQKEADEDALAEADPFSVETLREEVKEAWKEAKLTPKADLFSRILHRKVTNLKFTFDTAEADDLMRLLHYAQNEGEILPPEMRAEETVEAEFTAKA